MQTVGQGEEQSLHRYAFGNAGFDEVLGELCVGERLLVLKREATIKRPLHESLGEFHRPGGLCCSRHRVQ